MSEDPTQQHELAGELLELAQKLAREAGELLLGSVRRHDLRIERKSSATDLVTETDHAAERLIIDGIVAARPDDGVLGEEGGARPSRSGVRWVIDPIDGTTNFVYGIPAFGVSIAAELHGVTLAGVVAIPSLGETFDASFGGGARCNGAPIAASAKSDLATALVATGFAYQAETRREQGQVVARMLPEIRDIRRIGAASVDLCFAACGRVDAYFEAGLNRWDFAAGALIAAEAGATVTDLSGEAPSTRFLVAAAPGLHDALRELLVSSGAR